MTTTTYNAWYSELLLVEKQQAGGGRNSIVPPRETEYLFKLYKDSVSPQEAFDQELEKLDYEPDGHGGFSVDKTTALNMMSSRQRKKLGL